MPVKVKANTDGLKSFAKRLGAVDGLKVRVGVLKPDGAQPVTFSNETGEIGLTMAELATVQEFGRRDRSIPARPAMRRAASERREIAADFVGPIGRFLGGSTDSASGALIPAAAATVDRVRQSYETTRSWAKPNAPATVAAKGFDFPLTETGALKRSLSYEVTDRRGQVREKGKR